jgi:hypothetical protein
MIPPLTLGPVFSHEASFLVCVERACALVFGAVRKRLDRKIFGSARLANGAGARAGPMPFPASSPLDDEITLRRRLFVPCCQRRVR